MTHAVNKNLVYLKERNEYPPNIEYHQKQATNKERHNAINSLLKMTPPVTLATFTENINLKGNSLLRIRILVFPNLSSRGSARSLTV